MVIKRTLNICWWTAAAVVVALAVALSAARLLLPGMSEYREQVEGIAANLFGGNVRIGSLDAAWHVLSPVIRLNDVVVRDPRLPDGELAIQEVEVSVDVLNSILNGKLQTAGVKVIGLYLEVDTDVRNSPGKFPLQVVTDWLLRQDSVALEDWQLYWRDPGLFEGNVRLTNLSAKLVNTGAHHQLLMEAELPASQGETLKVAADLYGRPRDATGWRGTLYLKTHALQLSGFRPAMADMAMTAGGAADLELWVGIEQTSPVWGGGSLRWDKPGLHSAGADAQGIEADSLSTRFHWRRRDDKWRVVVADFELQREGQPVWPASQFNLVVQTGDSLQVKGTAGLVVLDELTALLPLLPWVDDNGLAMVDRLQPGGLMRDVEFEWRQRAGDSPRFGMRAGIENLVLAANGGLPGVAGVSGRIEGNLRAGTLQLDTSRAELVIPQLFGVPLPVKSLSGEISWRRFQDQFRLETKRLRAESGPLALESRWQMDWFYDQAAPFLDLQLVADPFPLTAVRDYLPAGVMPPSAVGWLQQAFLAGTASNARVLIQGRLNQMPFDAGQGRFEAVFDFDDATLAYGGGWGGMDKLNGYAMFDGRSMRITATSARILDSPVERAVAVIDDLTRPVLAIDGTVNGTVEAMLEYVSSSPLHDRFGELVDNITTSGDARLQLHLDLPLQHSLGEPRVKGDVALDGNDLSTSQSRTGLTDIHGTLHFTDKGVNVKSARARLLGQPVAVSVYRRGRNQAAAIVVDMQGKLKLVELAAKEHMPLASYLEGAAGWQVLLKIRDRVPPDESKVSVEVRSDLKGVAVALPPPFEKPLDEARPLTVEWQAGVGAGQVVRVSYGDRVSAKGLLAPGSGQLRKLAIGIGDSMPDLPPRDEVLVSGQLPRFDLDAWMPVFAALDGAAGAGLSHGVEVAADVFRFGGAQLQDIRVQSDSADPWYFRIAGEGAQGWLRWVAGGPVLPKQLLAKLDYLKISGSDKADSAASPAPANPAAFPELNIEIEDLHWGERDFDRLSLVSRATPEGVRFETLKLDSAAIALEGSGEWVLQDGEQTSRFTATISGGELEKLSALMGSPGTVRGGRLSGTVQCGWPGSPAAFSVAGMEGEFGLEAKDGRLQDVDEGAGKLLSLFSLNSLQRRLSLDFRDVVKEGFSFDVMKGLFVVADGNAFTENFAIEGTSVDIEVSGRTGLLARDYDQLVTVTPQVTSTLPIAGAIAGGPAVGAAVFLADKLVGDRFNRLTRVRYHVTGSWDKPVYTRLKKDTTKAPSPNSGSED